MPLFERTVDTIVTDNKAVIETLNNRIVELEKVLLATPNSHSDEWSDYVCTFCGSCELEHDADCVQLLAIKLRDQIKALKEPKP